MSRRTNARTWPIELAAVARELEASGYPIADELVERARRLVDREPLLVTSAEQELAASVRAMLPCEVPELAALLSELLLEGAAFRALLEELRNARPLLLYGEAWVDRIGEELADHEGDESLEGRIEHAIERAPAQLTQAEWVLLELLRGALEARRE